MDARANAQRLSRSAAVACLRVLTAFALALVCSIRCFLEQSQKRKIVWDMPCHAGIKI